MPISDFPHGFSNGVAIRGMPILNAYTGNVWWVDANAERTSGARGSYKNPFPSLKTALANTQLDDGDMICIAAGHTETISTTTLTISKKIKILGMGEGDMRPQFTVATASIYGLTVSADDVTICNLYFPASTAAATGRIYINAAKCTVENCYVLCGASDTGFTISMSMAGSDFKIQNNEFHIAAAGSVSAINIPRTVTRGQIRWNLFDGMSAANAWTSGTIYSSCAHTLIRIRDNDFMFMYASAGGVNFPAGSPTGMMRDNFFGGGALGYMLNDTTCYKMNNYENADPAKSGRLYPTSTG